MPETDGYDVLVQMNSLGIIEDVPVIMISAESAPGFITKAYDLGAADYVSRPFESTVVQRRVKNTIALYAKQRKLLDIVADQIYEKEKNSNMMISILSHIVEFRNGESGTHTIHINIITELLLKQLVKKDKRYAMSTSDIRLISTASSLHDIGKIAIPDEILNKPGRFTPKEYEIMKTHSEIGAAMLKNLTEYQDEPLLKASYEICRWHHERYDGKGYPDGLKGDEIPISAQVVSIADVYDALTSKRCYKKAYSHEKAIEMICGGECGTFNPLLLECLLDVSGKLEKELQANSPGIKNKREIREMTDDILNGSDLSAVGTIKTVKEDVSAKETKNMELSSLKQIGINTDSAIERFMGNEALYAKMLKKFLAEPTFAKLTAAVAESNGQAALEASHTLKGVCGNLSIESLFDLFAEQVVLMRADKWDEAYAMMPEITEKYNLVTDTLKSCLNVQ